MLLALLLRSTVALALVAPGPAPAPISRDYVGADAPADPPATAEAPTSESPASEAPTSEAPASEAPASVPAPTQPVAATAPAPLVEGPSEDVEDDIEEVPYDPRVDSPEAIRARHWVRSGIVFIVLGGVLSIGAIAMSQAKVNNPDTGAMPCNNRGDPAGNGCTAGGRSRATAALAVPGALLLGGGAAMLTVGKIQQKRLAASLQADRRGFQLGVTLRF